MFKIDLSCRTAEGRDVKRFIEGIFAGTAACIVLFTVYGLFLVRLHAGIISAQSELFSRCGLIPYVMPDDPLLVRFYDRVCSALFFGLTLGMLTGVVAAPITIVPWMRGFWGKGIDVLLTLLVIPICFLCVRSSDAPLLSLGFSVLAPLFFVLPWLLVVSRSTPRARNRKAVLALYFFLVLPFLCNRTLSPHIIRDAMVDMPIIRKLCDFYYDHSPLAAHVLQGVSDQTQRVIALSEHIDRVETSPGGTLWIYTADPCSITAASVRASTHRLDCPGVVTSVKGFGGDGTALIRELGARHDPNKALRRGIRVALHGATVVMVIIGTAWVAILVYDVARRFKPVSVVVVVVLFAALWPTFDRTRFDRSITIHTHTIRRYVLSTKARERYRCLTTFSDRLTGDELEHLARDPTPSIRIHAFTAMGKRRHASFLDSLGRGLADPNMVVRSKVCWAMGEIGGQKARALLEKALAEDSSWYVRCAAYRSIQKIEPCFKVLELL